MAHEYCLLPAAAATDGDQGCHLLFCCSCERCGTMLLHSRGVLLHDCMKFCNFLHLNPASAANVIIMRANTAATTAVTGQHQHNKLQFLRTRSSVVARHAPALLHSSPSSSRRTRSSRRSAVSCCCQHTFLLYTKPECPLCDGLKVRQLLL